MIDTPFQGDTCFVLCMIITDTGLLWPATGFRQAQRGKGKDNFWRQMVGRKVFGVYKLEAVLSHHAGDWLVM